MNITRQQQPACGAGISLSAVGHSFMLTSRQNISVIRVDVWKHVMQYSRGRLCLTVYVVIEWDEQLLVEAMCHRR